MPYFLTDNPRGPSQLYETDAAGSVVEQWLEARGEALRMYCVSGYIYGSSQYVTSEQMC